MRPYEPEDGEWFFGREDQVNQLTETVTHESGPNSITVVLGASGSGKSSLLRAGLIARIRAQENESASTPMGAVMTPGAEPIQALAIQLGILFNLPEREVNAALRADPTGFLRERALEASRPFVIVVDQFEELFTACHDEPQRRLFIEVLSSTVTYIYRTPNDLASGSLDSEPSILESGERNDAFRRPRRLFRVVLGVRADFLGELLSYPTLVDAVAREPVLVGPMDNTALHRAISEPARKAMLSLDEALVPLLLRDMTQTGRHGALVDPGALPLLSHALLTAWERGDRRRITVADYLEAGGVHGALANTADTIFNALGSEQQEITRRLMLRLVHVAADSPATRHRAKLADLIGQADDARFEQARDVLSRFVDQRLLTVDTDTIELSHEALLTAWPRLAEWIELDRAGSLVRRHLIESTRAWRDGGEEPGGLYRGTKLTAAVDYDRSYPHELAPHEKRFLKASVDADNVLRSRDRRRVRRLALLSTALAFMVLVAGAVTSYALGQRTKADRQRDLAISRQIAGTAERLSGSDPALAAQLSLAAYRVAPTVEARSAVIATTAGPHVTRMVHPGGRQQVAAVSPDGALIATCGADNADATVRLWDIHDPDSPVLQERILEGHTAAIYAATFSPDGRTLATGSGDKTVRLWNVTDSRDPVPIGIPLVAAKDRVLAVQYSPDGSILAAAGADKTLRLWDVHNLSRPVLVGQSPAPTGGDLQSIAFNSTGTVIATADAAKAIELWDITDPTEPHLASQPIAVPSKVNAVAISPDNTIMAAGSNDGYVRLWNIAIPSEPIAMGEPLPAATGWVTALAFNSDGNQIAVASADNAVQIWALDTRTAISTLPHPVPLNGVAFSNEDHALVTNTTDGTVRYWSIPGPVISAASRRVTTTAFVNTGAVLADAGTDVRLWDIASPERPTPLATPLTAPSGYPAMGGTLAITANGETLAAGTRSGPDGNAVLLWDISDPQHPVSLGEPLAGPTMLIESIAFSTNGTILAAASDDGIVYLWDVTNPRSPIALPTLSPGQGKLHDVTFSPDGAVLAAATQSGSVVIWDVRVLDTTIPQGTLVSISEEYTYVVTFSPDGRTLAVGNADGKVRLFNVDHDNLTSLGQPITGPDGYITALVFSPDNATLAGGTGTGQTWLWDVTDRTRPQATAIIDAPKGNTWALTFKPDGKLLASTPGDTRLLTTHVDEIADSICTTMGDHIAPDEWAKLVPGADYQDPCG